jgi:hypothetical protein
MRGVVEVVVMLVLQVLVELAEVEMEPSMLEQRQERLILVEVEAVPIRELVPKAVRVLLLYEYLQPTIQDKPLAARLSPLMAATLWSNSRRAGAI